MKVGSKVVLIKDISQDIIEWMKKWGESLDYPVMDVIYTVRALVGRNEGYEFPCILLEEVVNGLTPQTKLEPAFRTRIFREITPPDPMEEVDKLLNNIDFEVEILEPMELINDYV